VGYNFVADIMGLLSSFI